jgi:FKBP-type peptidyl-prolyl cis-trans isomerase FklB
MKHKIAFILLFSMVLVAPSIAQKKKDTKAVKPENKLENKLDSISYSIGILFGNSLIQNGVEQVNVNLLGMGVDEIINKKTPLIDEAKANEIIGKFMAEQHKAKSEKKLQEGKAFLDKNKTEPGVVTTASGLQYKILKEGNGEKPLSNSKVTVHYHGTLLDGKVFDSSVDRGQPVQLTVDGVIEGWKEALQLMPVGSKWKLFIPSNLGYGDQQGSPIEPNSLLIFEVELISIDKDAAQPALPEAQPKQ